MLYANNKGADQSAHLRSLISAFVVSCLDSIIARISNCEISSLYLASVAAQAPKTGFLDEAHICLVDNSVLNNEMSPFPV